MEVYSGVDSPNNGKPGPFLPATDEEGAGAKELDKPTYMPC
jgi:hypothetical protein